MKTCTICGMPQHCNSLCEAHYFDAKKLGLLTRNNYLRDMPDLERFEYHSSSKNANGCILWTGSPNASGYGVMHINGKSSLAHRAAYVLKVGIIPDGLQVLHRCDIRLCVNPDHLFLGTNADNVRDKISKSRQVRHKGIQHPGAKLTDSQVICIREDKRRHKIIASEYGLCRSTISYIKRRKLWGHIP